VKLMNLNLRVRLKIAKELVAISGVVELILGTIVGYKFGSQETSEAWLYTAILAVIAYTSTKLWIWCVSIMTDR
jgi:hypothetical protein